MVGSRNLYSITKKSFGNRNITVYIYISYPHTGRAYIVIDYKIQMQHKVQQKHINSEYDMYYTFNDN